MLPYPVTWPEALMANAMLADPPNVPSSVPGSPTRPVGVVR